MGPWLYGKDVGPFIGKVAITAIGFAGKGAASASTDVSGTGLNLALGEESRISVGASYVGEQGSLLGVSENDAFGWATAVPLAPCILASIRNWAPASKSSADLNMAAHPRPGSQVD
jgi:hypothetical protein